MSDELKFEKSLEKLEKIVGELETGSVDLEDALKKYEEGVKLSRSCQEKLTQAEKKIEVLTRALDGTLKKEPFDYEETGAAMGEGAARKKSPRKAGTSSENPEEEDKELLF